MDRLARPIEERLINNKQAVDLYDDYVTIKNSDEKTPYCKHVIAMYEKYLDTFWKPGYVILDEKESGYHVHFSDYINATANTVNFWRVKNVALAFHVLKGRHVAIDQIETILSSLIFFAVLKKD